MGTFVSPIDGKTYSTEWTGGAKTRTVANPVYDAYLRGQGKSESFDPAAMFSGWTGALTNKPGDALTYANMLNDPNYTDPQWVQNESFSGATNPNFKTQVEMPTDEYQQWLSHYWANLHPEEYAAGQREQKGGGGLFDMAVGLATSPGAMPLWAALGVGLGGLGGAGAAVGDAASLAAGDAMAGAIPAGELGAWTGASGLGTGGSNMGLFDDLLSQFTDVPVDATQFADQSIVDLFNNAGTEGFSNYGQSLEELAAELFNNAGTPGFDQLGNQATGLDWLKSQLGGPGSNTSTIQNAIKAFTSGGASGTGGNSLLGGNGSLLGAGAGALAGLLGGAKQAGTTDVTQTPWGPQQPFLLDAWAKAKAASEANNPLRNQAESNYQSVLQGPTKNPMLGLDNPYLQTQIDNANNDVTRAMMPAMIQANKASGSFGNSGVADIYGKAMTDAYSKNANDMRYKDYYAQQQLQKDAVGNTLGFTTGSSAFNAAPAQDYAKTVQGNYGGTTSSPYFTNPASSMLGGATLGYNLFGGK